MFRLRVKEIAAEKGISWQALSRRSDLNYKTVAKIMHDPYAEITTVTLNRLAEALGVSVKDLIDESSLP